MGWTNIHRGGRDVLYGMHPDFWTLAPLRICQWTKNAGTRYRSEAILMAFRQTARLSLPFTLVLFPDSLLSKSEQYRTHPARNVRLIGGGSFGNESFLFRG